MIKNIIIIALLLVIVYGLSAEYFLNYISMGLAKLQELVYYVQGSVK